MADVHVWRVEGAGGVRVIRNGVLIGDMTPAESSKTFTFNIGDTFSFEAYPSQGWGFEKFCADPTCATQTTANPFTGTIVAETGNLYVYFKRKSATVNVSVSGGGTVKVYRNGAYIGETKTSKVFNFTVGDTFGFEATPDTGNTFEKYCTDAACTIKTTQNPFTGTITSETGSLFAYFVKPGAPATVTVAVSQGGGTVRVYRNDALIGETKTSEVFNFTVGDMFRFEAVPDTGNVFEKYCSDQACAITTVQNPFTGTVTSETGTLFAYFTVPGPKGSINFTSTPAGARIFLDGIDQGVKTPATLTGVPVGMHTYAMRLSGYKDNTGTVQVLENQTTKVSTSLEGEGAGTGTLIGIALLGAGILGAAVYTTRR